MKKKIRNIRYRADRGTWEHRKYIRGRIYSGSHPTMEAAREALAKLERRAEIMRRVPTNTLGAVINDFLERSYRVGKSTWRLKALIYNFKSRIAPFFGEERPIADIAPADIERFVAAQKSRGVKNSTIWHYVVDLSAVFKHYIESYQVPIRNPVKGADLASIRNRRVVKPPFDPAALERAIAALNRPDDFQDWLYCSFICCTGARRGEANRTRWEDLFLDDSDNAWYRVPGTKTAGSLSLNPLPPSLARALRAAKISSSSEWVFPGRSAQTSGRQVMRRSATFVKIRRLTGLKLTSKDLRDYYASMVDTTDVRVLKELMRHANLSTTTTYSRRREELMRDAVKNLGVNFGVNQPPLLGQKRLKSPFTGNQHTDRQDWLSGDNIEEKNGGGGRSRTYDAADMSRVVVPENSKDIH